MIPSIPFPSTLPVPSLAAWIVGVVTVMLLAAAIASVIARRRSSATKHLVWQMGLVGALGVGLLAPMMPGVTVRVEAPRMGAALGALPSAADDATAPRRSASQDVAIDPSVKPSGATGDRVGAFDLPRVSLVTVWLAGAALIGAWWVMGWIGLAWLARRATPMRDPEWIAELERQRARFGLDAPVMLLRSASAGSPVSWWMRRLVVLLPADAGAWSADRRRVVLAHELAHAARGDHRAQLLACAACAVHWYHPLAWVAARRARIESERACDDQVLAQGTAGAVYAAHLLDVARSARAVRAMGLIAIGMARTTHLEGRLLAVLDAGRARLAPARRVRAAAWVALGAMAVGLAAMRPVPRRVDPVALLSRAPADSSVAMSAPASPGGVLDLDLETGAQVTITAGTQNAVSVRGELSGSIWRATRVTLEPAAKGVRLHVWFDPALARGRNQSSSHRFEITVPREYDVRISSAGGGITIDGVNGDFSGMTGGGEIHLEHVSGHAALDTGGGDIFVKDCTLDGHVGTGGGLVHLSNVKGSLSGSSGSGPVIYSERPNGDKGDVSELTVDRDGIHIGGSASGGGALHVSKAGGDIVIDSAPDGSTIKTGGGRIRVGTAFGQIRVGTGGGDIDVLRSTGSVRATTGAGSIRITVVRGDGAEHSVEISSGSGSAIIELPADLSANFDIETAYTENFGRKTKIQSDFPLERSETTDWDDSQGTPRKYVRAEGSIGGGAGRIRVRIVNGDVTIRRSKP